MAMTRLEFCWEIFEMDLSWLFTLFNVEETCKPQPVIAMRMQKSAPSQLFFFKILIYCLPFCNFVCIYIETSRNQLELDFFSFYFIYFFLSLFFLLQCGKIVPLDRNRLVNTLVNRILTQKLKISQFILFF